MLNERDQNLKDMEDSTSYKETRDDRKPIRDGPRMSRISTEKITVTRTDNITREEVKQHDHSSEQQVGRIVIDERSDIAERITEPKKVKTSCID